MITGMRGQIYPVRRRVSLRATPAVLDVGVCVPILAATRILRFRAGSLHRRIFFFLGANQGELKNVEGNGRALEGL
jgi:hypothetical protein